MCRKFKTLAASIILATAVASATAKAAEFAGDYDGKTLSVHLAQSPDGYTGEIQKGTQHYPVKAHADGENLAGSFSTPEGPFTFTANLKDVTLTLSSGGKTHILTRHTVAVNPLLAARPDQAAPNAAPAVAGDLAGYTTVHSSDFGKALSVEKPNATSITAAFQQTFPDLARYFGQRPSIKGVYEDVKDHRNGGASFTVKFHGQDVNGFVGCKLGEKGATLAVVYSRADAPKGEWEKLIAKPAEAQGPGAAAAAVKLREYQFPDGTGTVGIAEGWQTQSPSLMTGVAIKGPADQEVNLAFAASVNTMDSPLVQMAMQAAANARQWGFPPPPPLPVTTLIARYSDPENALKEITPQFSRISQAMGGPAITLDKIISVQKVNSGLPNGQAALIIFDLTKTTNGQAKHYRSGIRWDMSPVGAGAWMLYTSQVLAPTETYDRDLPAMLAMALSLQENPRVIMEKTQINIEAANARFAALQQANKELIAAYDEQNRGWERRSLIESRSFADFDETIVGYRTVEDTTTGYRRSVDLGNVHDIVDHLNKYDPGRYKEIPLRDEMYPLPGR